MGLFKRDSSGGFILLSRHPRNSPTWHWSVTLCRVDTPQQRWLCIVPKDMRAGQWHHRIRLPFGRQLIISRQDFHRAARARAGRA